MSGLYLIRAKGNWFKLSADETKDPRIKQGWVRISDVVYCYDRDYFITNGDRTNPLVSKEQIKILVWSYGGIENFPTVPINYYPGGL